AVGLQPDWQDANGRPQRVDPEVQRGLLEALGYPAQSPQQIEQSLAALDLRVDPLRPSVGVLPVELQAHGGGQFGQA
ncbi:hypothetical protein ACV34I_29505, partial [Pseudomonas aeruginosa]